VADGLPKFVVNEPDSIDSATGNLPVVLVGLPGSGKTHVGRTLADRLGWRFVDTDRVVVLRLGQSIAEIVAQRGWAMFRREEQEALLAALGRKHVVIASGGGSVESAANREAMATGSQVVWLRAQPGCLLNRLAADTSERPLLQADTTHRLAELRRCREPLYAGLATCCIDTDRLDVGQVVARIVTVLTTKDDGEGYETAN
jgi:shikimate kinase